MSRESRAKIIKRQLQHLDSKTAHNSMLKAHSNNNKVFFQHLNNIKHFLLPLQIVGIYQVFFNKSKDQSPINNLQIKFLNIIL